LFFGGREKERKWNREGNIDIKRRKEERKKKERGKEGNKSNKKK
jgi:hypothetical protein